MRLPPDRRAPLVVGLALLAATVTVLVATTPGPPLWEPAGATAGPTDPDLDFTAAEQQRSAALDAALEPWRWVSLACGLAAAAVLGLTPWGARWIGLVARPLGGGWAARAVVAGFAVSLVVRSARLPAGVMVERALREVGLSTRTWPEYALDWLRGLGVASATYALVFVIGYGLVRRFPRRWWAPLSLAAAAMVVAGGFVYPRVVEPLYNDFTPLAAGPLRADLVELAAERGLVVDDVLVMDASRRTTALNAYVSGFGSTRRIVLYDTLLVGASPEEVRSVVAHEIAHAAEGDVPRAVSLGALGSAAAVCLAFVVLGSGPARDGRATPQSPRLLRALGVDDAGDPRGAALVLFAVTIGTLVTAPVSLAVSRRVEARADLVALELTRDPGALVDLHRRLAVVNIGDLRPGLADRLLRLTHPAAPERIAAARRWAELNGVPVPAPRAGRATGEAQGSPGDAPAG